MRVKVRALIWIDGRLVIARQRRRGRTDLSLPGGRVNSRESVLDALKREVMEETGLEIEPGRLVYVSEAVEPAHRANLELIFLAEPRDVPRLNSFMTVDLATGERPSIRPAILDLIAGDAASGWRATPRWLGHIETRSTNGHLTDVPHTGCHHE